MSARCLRCHAGNEWIEGMPTIVATPPRPSISEGRVRKIARKWFGIDADAGSAALKEALREAGVEVTP